MEIHSALKLKVKCEITIGIVNFICQGGVTGIERFGSRLLSDKSTSYLQTVHFKSVRRLVTNSIRTACIYGLVSQPYFLKPF